VTRYNLPPADDPASIESFLRLRRSQLPGGRPPVRGTREAAERRSAEHDAERITDLLRRMPVEEYVPAADAGPEALEAAQYDWLRRHGFERRRVDAALEALRDNLTQQVHRDRSSSVADPVTAAAGGAPGRGRNRGRSAHARLSAAAAELRRDRLGMMRNLQEARRRGLDPAQLWPGQVGLPGRPRLNLSASGGADRPATVDQGRLEARSRAGGWNTPTPADRPDLRATGRRRRG
jgi:hypothetical protein